jgi:hypothetical protein
MMQSQRMGNLQWQVKDKNRSYPELFSKLNGKCGGFYQIITGRVCRAGGQESIY